jgi:hypothetical protein
VPQGRRNFGGKPGIRETRNLGMPLQVPLDGLAFNPNEKPVRLLTA